MKFICDCIFMLFCYKVSFSFSFLLCTKERKYNIIWRKPKYLIRNIASGCGWLTERCIGDRTRSRKDTDFPLALLHKQHNFLANILFNMTVVWVKRVKRTRDNHISTSI